MTGPYRSANPPQPPTHVMVQIPEEDFKDFVRWYVRETLGFSVDDFDEIQLSWSTKPGQMSGDLRATMWRNQKTFDEREDEDDEPRIGENSM